jgi:PTH1 family peptidyl-tRNA hydrolase
MKLIVGLGNPGPRYRASRHNIGFRVVEGFASRNAIALVESPFEGLFGRGAHAGVPVALLLPQTFMNASGRAVADVLAANPAIEPTRDLVVVYDDLDLPFARLRIRHAGGAGGHNGVANIIDAVGGRDFARIRFGIGRPPAGRDTIDYVLEEFSPAEDAILRESDRAVEALETLVEHGVEVAMTGFNSAPEPIP